ncbi:AfsR/SARP family transcriptional regulator [Actinomadura graeca]|uniref:AfsR/SARP family transcriptional regulator n=1 Tax=Actinomadura graeca TaxID=2750812 RepID=A0ABX8QXH7_9ACTN|nr:AfsR/SARP family transcriptional regulator [Actinomadura graeca]QXJ23398.1 AfsR/SARP family transcriptional regulator [Actinomadura graeca]
MPIDGSTINIEARMLGPLQVKTRQRSAVPSAAKPRTLLALLALNLDRHLSVDTLIYELWEDDPPRSAAITLQTYVLQVRRQLAEASDVCPRTISASVLRTVKAGYVFDPAQAWVDVHEFHRLADRGELADRAGRTDEAASLYRAAEELCAGSPLVDVEHGPALRAEVARLEQAALCVTERRIAAELRMGYHRAALGELASLVMRHPFHEDLHAQYMVALYRSGNRAGALDVFQKIRRTMTTELGLEPARKLRDLQEAIINADTVPEVLLRSS